MRKLALLLCVIAASPAVAQQQQFNLTLSGPQIASIGNTLAARQHDVEAQIIDLQRQDREISASISELQRQITAQKTPDAPKGE